MVKARWQMFQNGDYLQNVVKITDKQQQFPRFKTPRNVIVVDNSTLLVNLTTTTTPIRKIPGK